MTQDADYTVCRTLPATETPASRFDAAGRTPRPPLRPPRQRAAERVGEQWVARRIASNGVISISWQQISVGKHHSGQRCDVLVSAELLQLWVADRLVKTVARKAGEPIRKKHAAGTGRRH